MNDAQRELYQSFQQYVNLQADELAAWLDTPESQAVGVCTDSESESTGHQSGRHIVAIQQKSVKDLTDADFAHMRKVIGYIKRHTAQGGPKDDVEHSRWRYSLLNWGHDPLK